METVTGVFQSREQAERAIQQIHAAGIRNDRIALLTPQTDRKTAERAIPTSDSEQPGMGKAMGGTVGGAMGVAGGATLGAAAASVLIPGVGPVLAGAILGAARTGRRRAYAVLTGSPRWLRAVSPRRGRTGAERRRAIHSRLVRRW